MSVNTRTRGALARPNLGRTYARRSAGIWAPVDSLLAPEDRPSISDRLDTFHPAPGTGTVYHVPVLEPGQVTELERGYFRSAGTIPPALVHPERYKIPAELVGLLDETEAMLASPDHGLRVQGWSYDELKGLLLHLETVSNLVDMLGLSRPNVPDRSIQLLELNPRIETELVRAFAAKCDEQARYSGFISIEQLSRLSEVDILRTQYVSLNEVAGLRETLSALGLELAPGEPSEDAFNGELGFPPDRVHNGGSRGGNMKTGSISLLKGLGLEAYYALMATGIANLEQLLPMSTRQIFELGTVTLRQLLVIETALRR